MRMKYALLMCLALAGARMACAQANTELELLVSIDGITKNYRAGDCGFQFAAFGQAPDSDLCGRLEWTSELTACNPVQPPTAPDRWALIRRGGCPFAQKCYNAETAGYKVAVVVNGEQHAVTQCDVVAMQMTAPGLPISIPSIFLSKGISEQIADALDQGKKVELCLYRPRMDAETGAYAYATPVSQVAPLKHVGARFHNRSDSPMTDVVIRVDLLDESGALLQSASRAIPLVEAGKAVFEYVSTLNPPAQKGLYTLVYSNNKYTETYDTIRRQFEITDYTFALDNMRRPLSKGFRWGFEACPGGETAHLGALFFTGPQGGVAECVTFGMHNGDTLPKTALEPASYIIVYLYDGDFDNDGEIDYKGSFDHLVVVAANRYDIEGHEVGGKWIDVALESVLLLPKIELKPNHPYYVGLYYYSAGYVLLPELNASGRESYVNFPTQPARVASTSIFTDWPFSSFALRLQLEGYSKSVGERPLRLEESKVTVTPNPAGEWAQVNLHLDQANEQVQITLHDMTGRPIETQTLKGIREGSALFDLRGLPSGIYFVRINATQEGALTRLLSVAR